MNILFVNYGDFSSNSLNHIAGFCQALGGLGHACVVAVPRAKETVKAIPAPAFIAATFGEALNRTDLFPDGRAADVLHAWTPREGVRKFILAHQSLHPDTRVIVHLEDNEEHLIEAFGGKPVAHLRDLPEQQFPFPQIDGLAHPVRWRQLLRLADGATIIVDRLGEHVPAETPTLLLEPGVDFSLYAPQAADPALRRQLGIKEGECVIVFTGSVTFANAKETAELYRAVHLLNETGTPTRLVRTGITHPDFKDQLGFDPKEEVIELGFTEKERLPGLLALADVLVQPGRPGAFNDYRLPSKVPEFLSMGKPVVLPATNVGLQLKDGKDALLLREGSAGEIAEMCRRVFVSPLLADQLGKNALQFAHERFDLRQKGASLAQFYEKIRQSPARAPWHELRLNPQSELPLLVARLRTSLRSSSPRSSADHAREVLAEIDDVIRAIRQLDFDLAERSGTIEDLKRHATALEETRTQLNRDIATVREHAAQHARQLEAAVTQVSDRARRLEETTQQLEAALAQSLRRARQLEENGAKLLREISDVRAQAAVHAGQLLDEIHRRDSAIEQGRQKTREICDVAESEVARLQDQLYESEYRVRRMQASFSWQATAWLRALRRSFIDRWFGAPKPPPAPPRPHRTVRFSPGDLSLLPPAPKFNAHLDAPRRWPVAASDLTVRGWVISEAGALKGVRARVGGRLYAGQYGVSRPDVGHNFRHLPHAGTAGFSVIISLAETDPKIELDAQDASGHWHVFYSQALGADQQLVAPGSYPHWVQEFDTLRPEQRETFRQRAKDLKGCPLISILMPVYNTPERWLVRAIESVRGQFYPNWELCVADDASTQPHVRPLLERFAQMDPRIKPVFRPANGHISATSNSALAVATGEFCALCDHDDELPPHALLCIAETLAVHPDAEVIYSDEDKIDENGMRFDPHFKPDWNPELLHAQNYLSHLTVYRTTTLRAADGFRLGFEGAQDWDLALRITARVEPAHIHHIPHVLYHWRAIEGSTAMQLQEKSYASEAARRALEEHFARRQEPVTLRQIRGGHWQVSRARPQPAPLVTLVIPTRNRRELLVTCVESIFAHTAYPRFEILIADNDSDDPELFAFYERMKTRGRFEVLSCPGPFNFSAINNRAVRGARGEIIGLLNNDLEAIHPEWLDEMVAHAVRSEIGCVGAKLYYPDMRIQHAGVITGLGGVAGHPFKGFTRDEPGTPQFRPHVAQNLSAVTAACLVLRKSVFLKAGGFDETGLSVAFNDVDFCLKVQALGYRNLFTPFAELLHHESASRGAEDTPEKIVRFQQEIACIQERWGDRLRNDPAYNPNLTLAAEDFGFAYPPRVSTFSFAGTIDKREA